jgi:hypothetical protein
LTSGEAIIIDRHAVAVQAQNGKPISGDPFPTNTRRGSTDGRARGNPAQDTKDLDSKFGIRIQNKSLKPAADAGDSVVQQPKETPGRDGKPLLTEAQQRGLGIDPDRNGDALINGQVCDVYSPTSVKLQGVHQGIGDKVGRELHSNRHHAPFRAHKQSV